MRRVTIWLDHDPHDPMVRAESIVEEIVHVLIHGADEDTKRYLRVRRVKCGNAETIDLKDDPSIYGA